MGAFTNNLKFGLAYDEFDRSIKGLDSPDWAYHASVALQDESIANYLTPGSNNYVEVDYGKFFAATDYDDYLSLARENTTSNSGAPTGAIDEAATAAYVEGNYDSDIGDYNYRINAGLRFVSTEQKVKGLQNSDNGYVYVEDKSDYSNWLPAVNGLLGFTEDMFLRAALSRTLTRPNPASMFPSTIFVDPTALYASQGNPNLKPFTSDNFDLAFEWYFAQEGYASVTYFRKEIDGLTTLDIDQIPVQDLLDQIGITDASLSVPQREAVNQRGGPAQAQVGVVQSINVDGTLNLQGVELTWVQPLPMVLEGFGYSINVTHVDQDPEVAGVPRYATEVSENTVNTTLYYEDDRITLRLSNSWYDEQYGSQVGLDNIASAQRFIDARSQWDLSASYELIDLPTSPKITFNLINFASDPQREVVSFDNAAYRVYDPGYTAVLGIRGTF